MIKPILVICFLAMACLCSCSPMLAKPSQVSTSQGKANTPPTRGLRVTEVFPGSPAEAVGIHKMDLMTQYGEYQIVDDAGYFAARNHYEEYLTPMVEIVLWRGAVRISAKVPSGRLGVTTIEDDKVSQEFSALMSRINSMRGNPEYYMPDRKFKGQFKGPEEVLEKAKALVDQAEREGTLTPAQVQVARIYMILDDSPEKDQRQLTELLKQLIATQPVSYIHMLGNDKFFKDKRYHAAIACLTQYLKISPDDVSMRLNLAFAYNQVGMYDEAEAAADYVFDHKLKLSDHGHVVGYLAKATAALGHKDYRKSIEFAERGFAIEPASYPLMLVQLAAVQMGDAGKSKEAAQKLQRELPDEYLEKKLSVDSVAAYAMVKNNQRDAARELVGKWKNFNLAEAIVIAYWRNFPDGMDVARNWADLMQN